MKRTPGALRQKAFSLGLSLGHRRWDCGTDSGPYYGTHVAALPSRPGSSRSVFPRKQI